MGIQNSFCEKRTFVMVKVLVLPSGQFGNFSV